MDLLEEHKVTTICWVVSALAILVKLDAFAYKRPPALDKIIFTGAVMPSAVLRKRQDTYPEALYMNHYGPTEITASCTYAIIDHPVAAGEELPIGRPFPNTEILLLDENDGLVTHPQERGEICVRGSSLALGYMSMPEATAKAFVQNPLNKKYRDLIYRTGDIGSWDEQGVLWFHGRKDKQIKLMGRRIEMTEIELTARAMSGVREACCFFDTEKEMLYLFYESNTVQPRELGAFLKRSLPGFMVPRRIISKEAFPLCFNGKIDMEALKKEMKE